MQWPAAVVPSCIVVLFSSDILYTIQCGMAKIYFLELARDPLGPVSPPVLSRPRILSNETATAFFRGELARINSGDPLVMKIFPSHRSNACLVVNAAPDLMRSRAIPHACRSNGEQFHFSNRFFGFFARDLNPRALEPAFSRRGASALALV